MATEWQRSKRGVAKDEVPDGAWCPTTDPKAAVTRSCATGCSAATESAASSNASPSRPKKAGALRRWPATVYETFRALRGAGLLDAIRAPRYRLAAGTDLADALRTLIVVLKVEGAEPVARRPRTRT